MEILRRAFQLGYESGVEDERGRAVLTLGPLPANVVELDLMRRVRRPANAGSNR